jgi:hypothetical protein
LINRLEINFLKHLLRDNSIWEFSKAINKKNSKMNLFFTNNNLLPNVKIFKNFNTAKVSLFLDFSFEKCLSLVNFLFYNNNNIFIY